MKLSKYTCQFGRVFMLHVGNNVCPSDGTVGGASRRVGTTRGTHARDISASAQSGAY